MTQEGKVHTVVLISQGLLMLGLGLSLFWLKTTMTSILFEVTGCIVAVLLTGACLLLASIVDYIGGLAIPKGHRRELHLYIISGSILMMVGLFLWVSPYASVQALAIIAGIHGIFWGILDLRLASHLEDHCRERKALRILGGVAMGIGILLIAGPELSSRDAVMLLACYLTYIGIHLVMIGIYIFHPWKKPSYYGRPAGRIIHESCSTHIVESPESASNPGRLFSSCTIVYAHARARLQIVMPGSIRFNNGWLPLPINTSVTVACPMFCTSGIVSVAQLPV